MLTASLPNLLVQSPNPTASKLAYMKFRVPWQWLKIYQFLIRFLKLFRRIQDHHHPNTVEPFIQRNEKWFQGLFRYNLGIVSKADSTENNAIKLPVFFFIRIFLMRVFLCQSYVEVTIPERCCCELFSYSNLAWNSTHVLCFFLNTPYFTKKIHLFGGPWNVNKAGSVGVSLCLKGLFWYIAFMQLVNSGKKMCFLNTGAMF